MKLFKKIGKKLILGIIAAWFDDNWAYRKAITVIVTSSKGGIK